MMPNAGMLYSKQVSRHVSWKVSHIRGHDMFEIGISSLCLICLDLFHEYLSTQAAVSWPDPPAAHTDFGFVQSFLSY